MAKKKSSAKPLTKKPGKAAPKKGEETRKPVARKRVEITDAFYGRKPKARQQPQIEEELLPDDELEVPDDSGFDDTEDRYNDDGEGEE